MKKKQEKTKINLQAEKARGASREFGHHAAPTVKTAPRMKEEGVMEFEGEDSVLISKALLGKTIDGKTLIDHIGNKLGVVFDIRTGAFDGQEAIESIDMRAAKAESLKYAASLLQTYLEAAKTLSPEDMAKRLTKDIINFDIRIVCAGGTPDPLRTDIGETRRAAQAQEQPVPKAAQPQPVAKAEKAETVEVKKAQPTAKQAAPQPAQNTVAEPKKLIDIAFELATNAKDVPEPFHLKREMARQMATSFYKNERLSGQRRKKKITELSTQLLNVWENPQAAAEKHLSDVKYGSMSFGTTPNRKKLATIEIPNVESLRILNEMLAAKDPKNIKKRSGELDSTEKSIQDAARYLFTKKNMLTLLNDKLGVTLVAEYFEAGGAKHVSRVQIRAANQQAADTAKSVLNELMERTRVYRKELLKEEMGRDHIKDIVDFLAKHHEKVQQNVETAEKIANGEMTAVATSEKQPKQRLLLAEGSNPVATEAIELFRNPESGIDVAAFIGPPATGKTHLMVALTAEALLNGDIKNAYFVRSLVEAGEKMGFLPGEMGEKVAPFLEPIKDVMKNLPAKEVEYVSARIHFTPLAFMRGRTLDGYLMLDEAQNTTSQQGDLFITRAGRNSKILMAGDTAQSDLPPGRSGLPDMLNILKMMPGTHIAQFSVEHAVHRSPLVRNFLEAAAVYRKSQPQPVHDGRSPAYRPFVSQVEYEKAVHDEMQRQIKVYVDQRLREEFSPAAAVPTNGASHEAPAYTPAPATPGLHGPR